MTKPSKRQKRSDQNQDELSATNKSMNNILIGGSEFKENNLNNSLNNNNDSSASDSLIASNGSQFNNSNANSNGNSNNKISSKLWKPLSDETSTGRSTNNSNRINDQNENSNETEDRSLDRSQTVLDLNESSRSSQFYSCDKCDKTFGKQSSLARHKYEHSGKAIFLYFLIISCNCFFSCLFRSTTTRLRCLFKK